MSAVTDLSNPKTIADLVARRQHLERLQKQIETELCAVINGLRVAGLVPAGRPRLPPEFTAAEARAAHARHQRGDKDPLTVAGERQYQRDRKRRERGSAA